MIKKMVCSLMVVAAMLSFGCSGRNADFGVVDMKRVETEAVSVKNTKDTLDKQLKELKEQLDKELAGKSGAEADKLVEDYSARAKLVQSEAQNKLKASLETALHQVAREKSLGAILVKEAVPEGGKDVTQEIIDKMK